MIRVLRRALPGLLPAVLCLTASAQDAKPAPDYAHAPQMRRLLHWPRFPLRVCFAPGELTNEERKAATRAGLDEWVRATHDFVRYQVVADPAQADVTVIFLPEASVPGKEGAAGNTGLTFAGPVLRKARVRLATAGAAPADLQATAAHEFGHALGIDGHSDDPADLTYPVLVGPAPAVTGGSPDLPIPLHVPTARDLSTLKLCYPALVLPPAPNPAQ